MYGVGSLDGCGRCRLRLGRGIGGGGLLRSGRGVGAYRFHHPVHHGGENGGESLAVLKQGCPHRLPDGKAASVQLQKAGLRQIGKQAGVLQILRGDDKTLAPAAAENCGVVQMGV
ncbi:hypothetical protein SDC9_174357 [bioreactor metagenome]|uniref:Uncharacterized protein n=1 Tax=bioreactor metagenome TaxID=1076179 RepID=A0A645GIX7_9ZZZZ